MHKIRFAGVLMIVAGLIILLLLGSFIVGVIVYLLELLAVVIGVVLVLGGIAAIVIGPRWKRRPWDWEPHKESTGSANSKFPGTV